MPTQTMLSPIYASDDAAAFDLSDDELRDAAKSAAASVRRLVRLWAAQDTQPTVITRTLRQLAKRHRIELPSKDALAQTLNRLSDPSWWHRALRKRFRLVEHAAIACGRVHRHAAPYVSDSAMRRASRNRRRIADLLASLEAINQTTGQVLVLGDVADKSLANPANRRKALAARIKGIEQYATAKGQEALFLTITVPSRMHPRHSASGAANERFDGTSPRQAQAYLCKLWGRAMRKLAHGGVAPYGMRVVEPHHDGCPHWHVLVFVEPDHAQTLAQTLRAYALCDSPDEPGAAERRFRVERIDPDKGSALGYVLKYVSKSIDGEGVGADNETRTPAEEASQRIVAWARLWGIRQFQFFGVPAITPTRELFRVDADCLPGRALRAAHDATKANDYAAWLHALDAHALQFRVDYIERPSTRYPDEVTRRITGLTAHATDLQGTVQLTTRADEWRIQARRDRAASADAAPPWTRFNNSAPVDSIEVFGIEQSDTEPRDQQADGDNRFRLSTRAFSRCHAHPLASPIAGQLTC